MKKNRLFAAALLAVAPVIALPAPSSAHPHKGKQHYKSHKKQRVAYPGQDIDGYHIRNYVFVYADLDNDGVLRGREVRRARDRAAWEDRGDSKH